MTELKNEKKKKLNVFGAKLCVFRCENGEFQIKIKNQTNHFCRSPKNNTQNNNQSVPGIDGNETNKPTGSETEAFTDSALKNDIESDVNLILDKSINGCFASASLSAMLTVSAIFGLALIKKKKYDE